MRNSIMLLLAGAMLATFCTGCQKFTRQRFETVYVGQPSYNVEQTLGKPTTKFEDQWTYINNEPFYKAVIQFDRNARVTRKQWFNDRYRPDVPVNESYTGLPTLIPKQQR